MDSNVTPFAAQPGARTEPKTDGRGTAKVGRAVYTVEEVAYLLSLSLSSTYGLIRSGDIPAIRVGGRWMVPKRRFQEWLDNLPEATDEEVRRELDKLDRTS